MREIREVLADLRLAFTLVPWRMRPKLLGILIGSLAIAAFDLVAVVITLPLMQVISGMTPEDSAVLRWIGNVTGLRDQQGLLITILVAVVVTILLKNLGAMAFRWWNLGVVARATSDASYSMLTLYTTSPWVSHRQRKRDDIYQTMTGYVPGAFATAGDVILLAVDIFSAFAVMAALLMVSPNATLVALVFFGGAAWVLQAVLKRAQLRLGETARVANVKSWFFLQPAIDGFKEARIANASARFSRDYASTRYDASVANRSVGVLGEVPRLVLELLMILGIMVVAGFLFLTSSQEEAFAFLGVFAVGSLRIVPSLNRAVATLGRIRTALPSLRALTHEIRTLRLEPRPTQAGSDTHSFPMADIVFDQVTFTFPDADEPVLDRVSGVIPKGHTVALVGSSGAGKTTFVDMLLALFTPDQGSMTVDGVSIHDHPIAWWQQLGMVAQDVFAMPRSIRENVAFGFEEGEIDDGRVREALHLAQLDDFVADMPEGIHSLLGQQGLRLSGGQRQRIGIARALYRQPQVLILDEATSALDNETESRITQTLKGLHGKVTIVVVAHRLSTVKHADQILFFSQGRIAARGTMAELVESNEEFANLVRLGQLN
ncbi:ABC transporter ATP-binding protein [Tessaracoccus sp. MC1627]|uniref:ABC transporter ATP-binding protein n=1 Tax=Tessaracoccus sp. MC1627 TaxID=2760312 RepID=UPI001602B76C|nr:ABC transporter ATP-binding protein [Tessaracoccus sp. MC1627]MBB1513472.1 ABC transporter ATP-binding protein [Tessaracoccus sp. MC1627]